jgi:hypothetical protein
MRKERTDMKLRPYSTCGTAIRCCCPPHHQSVDAMDLEEDVLMIVLIHKKISEKERHQYWVHPDLYKTRIGSIPKGRRLLSFFYR